MSFPRAKILRFNEKSSETPSPAEYNVASRGPTIGGTISKSGRMVDRSPAASDAASVKSGSSVQTFLTPTVIKKKKSVFNLLSKSKLNDLMKDTETEALKDKIVECQNKDSSIKDLNDYVEELKEQLSQINRAKVQFEREKCKLEEIVKDLKEEHRMVLEKVYLEHDKEISELRSNLYIAEGDKAEAEVAMIKLKEQVEKFVAEEEKFERIQERVKELEESVRFKDQELELKAKHGEEIKKVNEKYEKQISDLQYEVLQNWNKVELLKNKEKELQTKHIKEIAELISKYEEEKNKIIEDHEARVKQMQEDSNEARLLADMQMQEKCTDIELTYKLKLEEHERNSQAVLRECQIISENYITQCEVEKNEILMQLDKKVEEIKELHKANADLNIKCTELQLKCKDLQDNSALQEELDKCRQELRDALNQKKFYDISISKSHETINTLKKRLLDSDRDVEQLTMELDKCENDRLQYEGKCFQLQDELEMLEKECLQKINDVQDTLLAKLETYQKTAQADIEKYKSQYETERELKLQALEELQAREEKRLVEQMQELSFMHEEKNNMAGEIANLRNIVKQLNFENGELKQKALIADDYQSLLKQLTHTQDKCETYIQYTDYYKLRVQDLEAEIQDLNGINKKYIDQSGKVDELLQTVEELKKAKGELERKVQEQNDIIGPFRDQLEAYELENREVLNEAKVIGLKYAELVGHQNHRQKIKHLWDLKTQNNNLMQENKEMKLKVATMQKQIERMCKESGKDVSKLNLECKENAKPRSLNLTPGGILRPRN